MTEIAWDIAENTIYKIKDQLNAYIDNEIKRNRSHHIEQSLQYSDWMETEPFLSMRFTNEWTVDTLLEMYWQVDRFHGNEIAVRFGEILHHEISELVKERILKIGLNRHAEMVS